MPLLSEELLTALKAAAGYLINAKIDLETGAPKRTAIRTIEGGLNVVNAATAKAEEQSLANDHLIAAAPDMLAAILNSDDAHWTPAMRAAIAKATGA